MFVAHNGSFGRRVLKIELAKLGYTYSERKISRILKQLGCTAKYGRRKGKNVHTSENTTKYIQDNLFRRLSEEERCNEIWSMDFTEQKIAGKKIFTCGIISVNRKVLVGFSQGSKCTTALALKAFNQALEDYGNPYMVMTDRGPQFTSEAFYDTVKSKNILHSMSRPYTPADNIYIETFWKSMKMEIGSTKLLTPETYAMVVEYYMHYYNNLRPHSTLGYLAPHEAFPLRRGNASCGAR